MRLVLVGLGPEIGKFQKKQLCSHVRPCATISETSSVPADIVAMAEFLLDTQKPASLLDKRNDCRWRHEQTNDLS